MDLLFANDTAVDISATGPVTRSSSLTVTAEQVWEGAVVADAQVMVRLQHSYVGDLQLTLVSPAGTRTILIANQGGSGDDFVDTVFSDRARQPVEAAQAPYSGQFRPVDALGGLAGENPVGTWTLEVDDRAVGDGGTLLGWELGLEVDLSDEAILAQAPSAPEEVTAEETAYLSLPDRFLPADELTADEVQTAAATLDTVLSSQLARLDLPHHLSKQMARMAATEPQSIAPANTLSDATVTLADPMPRLTLLDTPALTPLRGYADLMRDSAEMIPRLVDQPVLLDEARLADDVVGGLLGNARVFTPLPLPEPTPGPAPAPLPQTPKPLGLALSGGGAKGSFEAGAILYLEWANILPQVSVVSGTSVGAINALAVSYFQDKAGTQVRRLWSGLKRPTDMYQTSASMRSLETSLGALGLNIDVMEMFNPAPQRAGTPSSGLLPELRISPAHYGLASVVGILTPQVFFGLVMGAVRYLEVSINDIISALNRLDRLFDLSPVRRLLRSVLPPPSSKTIPLQMVFVSAADGGLWYADETGMAQQMQIEAPRKPIGAPRQINGTDVRDRVIRAALASSSIPFIFGHEFISFDGRARPTLTCWDGGVRDVLPLHAAANKGAERIIAVSAGTRQIERVADNVFADGASPPVLGTITRSTDILVHEAAENDRLSAGSAEVIHIQPITNIHEMTQIEPRLISLNMCYGYMTAFDKLHPAPKNLRGTDPLSALLRALHVITVHSLREDFAKIAHELHDLEFQKSAYRDWFTALSKDRTRRRSDQFVVPWTEAELNDNRARRRKMSDLLFQRAMSWGDLQGSGRNDFRATVKGKVPSVPTEARLAVFRWFGKDMGTASPWLRHHVLINPETVAPERTPNRDLFFPYTPGWDA